MFTKVTLPLKLSPVRNTTDPKVIPSIAYTEPEVAWVGLTEKEAKEKGISYETATFRGLLLVVLSLPTAQTV